MSEGPSVDEVVAELSAELRRATAADEPCRAAMVCVELSHVYGGMLGNLTAAKAWARRACRMVEDRPPCLEQGWAAVALMGCDVDDPAELLAAAELALDRARRFGDVNLETKALADGGLAHVQAGRIDTGMVMLDEAMALAAGPADDLDASCRSVCSFFTACYHAADFARVDAWSTPLRQRGLISPEAGGPVFLSSHCDSVQATLLVELGRWSEAEALLERAHAEFESAMQAPSWHPAIALADLRVRQGRLADAEALLVGKDQSIQALLPTARLHLARGDLDLTRAAVRRGLAALGDDRLRAVELLAVAVDAELAAGDTDAAARAAAELAERTVELPVAPLRARAAVGRARVLAATGDHAAAADLLEATLAELAGATLPWLAATVRLELAASFDALGDTAAARAEAAAAATALGGLDVVCTPREQALLDRLGPTPDADAAPGRDHEPATLTRDGAFWTARHDGQAVRLRHTKGLAYLAELIAHPGQERHALDLVDRVEGVDPDGPDRRALGDAGPLADGQAREAYRRRIEALRADVDEALADDRLEAAEALQGELDQLVAQLAAAFGLSGRDRRAASAAERARLNVTRSLRAAVTRLTEALPAAGAALDRHLRTGRYCCYTPGADGPRWIVQSAPNGTAPD